ncbi:MAG: leucyl/phenylalanyl-tRNA--protein transferase [Gallionella sp.]|nr:leucyl/phenylalanyl-tRNA--protein transferase [Gallionella sp.]
MIPWLQDHFPPVSQALSSPNGLLAAGGDLSAAWLLDAYRQGIFPWYNEGDPILWWSPDPRTVFIPDQFNVSTSLNKVLRKHQFEVTFDQGFEQVMRCCAAPRKGAKGTWISEDIIAAYCELQRLGHAHSVEVWVDKKLTGGLYGIAIGKMFYGESMFSNASNGSKIALAHLAKQLARWQFGMIDCQMSTTHLTSLGAQEISRGKFIAYLQELVHCEPHTNWQFDSDLFT